MNCPIGKSTPADPRFQVFPPRRTREHPNQAADSRSQSRIGARPAREPPPAPGLEPRPRTPPSPPVRPHAPRSTGRSCRTSKSIRAIASLNDVCASRRRRPGRSRPGPCVLGIDTASVQPARQPPRVSGYRQARPDHRDGAPDFAAQRPQSIEIATRDFDGAAIKLRCHTPRDSTPIPTGGRSAWPFATAFSYVRTCQYRSADTSDYRSGVGTRACFDRGG